MVINPTYLLVYFYEAKDKRNKAIRARLTEFENNRSEVEHESIHTSHQRA